MAVTPPPGIDPVPTPPIQRGDRATFSSRVDAFIRWLVNAVVQFAALAANVYANAVDAAASGVAAAGFRDTAQTYRDAAQAARDLALQYRNAAQDARDAAQAARDMASAYAEGLTATSTTSLVIGTGSKTFTGTGLQAKQFSVGQLLRATNPTNTAQWMVGTVTAYSDNGASSSVTLNVTDLNSATSGQSNNNWLISISGVKGATGSAGGINGGSLTGALNYRRADNDIPSASIIDIWSGNGNYVGITGTANITKLGTAPQAGAHRRLLALGAFTLTPDANMVVKGGAFTAGVGDEIDVYAESTTLLRVTRVPASGTRLRSVVLSSGSAWTVAAQDFVVECIAGGSGGNGFSGTNSAGGRSGGYLKKAFNGATIGSSAAISIGTAGAAGSATTNGSVGGNTTFTLSGFTSMVASSSGASTGGDLIVNGVPGGTRGGTVGAGASGGSGASTPIGTGGLGGTSAGVSGSGYGSGGAGGGTDGTNAFAGGAGAPGVIIITYIG